MPKHRGSLQAAYSNADIATVALGVQFVGLQYNDDLNVNFIPAATLTDGRLRRVLSGGAAGVRRRSTLSVSRNFGRNIQVFFGVQNLFDKVYFVQTNPSTIGTPRLVNGGVRDSLGWPLTYGQAEPSRMRFARLSRVGQQTCCERRPDTV